MENKQILVHVTASWCEPCQLLKPVLKEIEQELKEELKIVEIDFDEHQEFALNLDVTGVPALFLYKDEKIVGRAAGYMPKKALIEFVQKTR